MARLRFPLDGEELTTAEVLDRLSHRDGAMRRKAAQSIGEVLERNVGLFALITNTLAKDKQIDDKWRRYPQPISARNLANQVEDDVVEALVGAVRNKYGRLSHRYYALKARWFGVDRLDHWDRNAPLPEDDDRSEEHTSELQSLMRISYAVFCLKKKNTTTQSHYTTHTHQKTTSTTYNHTTHK